MSDGTPPSSYIDALKRRGFTITERLGSGAFGSVWKATQDRFRRPVAVKCFDSKIMNTDDNRKRFENEAPLLARVRHPSIPYVITAGEFMNGPKSIPFHVMEFVDGPTLDVHLQAAPRNRLSVTEACGYMVSVLRALHAAHEVNVLHRDVKPNNIILSPIGTYLIDFSLGCCLDYTPGLTRPTLGKSALGTDYASPEQRQDARSVDRRTDIYSAGVTLMQMLSGVMTDTSDVIELALPDTDPKLRRLIIKACEKNRDRRFESALDFANAIAPYANVASVAAQNPALAFCPNPACTRATRSNSGYFRGPYIDRQSTVPYCSACGTLLVRACPSCRRPLPKDLEDLVVTQSRTSIDRLSANCAHCGASIFVVPTCKRCGSLLQIVDLDKDTKKDGCQKCIRKAQQSGYDDIPF